MKEMQNRRREFLAAAAGLASVAAVPCLAQPQYPNRKVRVLMGYAAGGAGDVTMRIVAEKLSQRLGQSFYVDNQPGAGGIVASKTAANATPDGYTLNFIASGNFSITPALFKSLPFDPVNDFQMISMIGTFGSLMAVRADSPIKSVRDVIERAKANPGKLNVGAGNVGSAQHLCAELFKAASGTTFTTIPYRTSGSLILALRGGDIDVAFDTVASLIGSVKSGALRGVAYSEAQRFEKLPDVPTYKESGLPAYEVSIWNGVAAPAGMPRHIVEQLSSEIAEILRLPDVKAQFLDLGVIARSKTPEEMTAVLKLDIEKWRGIIETAGIERQ